MKRDTTPVLPGIGRTETKRPGGGLIVEAAKLFPGSLMRYFSATVSDDPKPA
jgi:hypothetical protein